MRTDRRDAVVVGGDLFGLIFAQLAAAAGRSVDVLVGTQVRPPALGWLESGLLEPGGDADGRGYYDGLEMLEYFGYPLPKGGSILSLTRQDEVSRFLNHANARGLLRRALRISNAEARAALGAFFVSDATHFRVPDLPFPLADLTRIARARAEVWGVRFHECPVSLEIHGDATNGYVLKAGSTWIDPAITVVSGGADTPAFVEQLFLAHDVVVIPSWILEIDSADGLPARLLTDGSTGFVVASIDKRECPPKGRLLIRREESKRFQIESQDAGSGRPNHKDLLLSYASSFLPIGALPHRFIAGNTLGVLINGRLTHQPTLFAPSEFPGLLFATTAKSMQALSQARRALSVMTIPRPPRRKAA